MKNNELCYSISEFIRNFATQMRTTDQLILDLRAMKEGNNALHFDLSDDFFESLDDAEVRRGDVSVDINADRVGDYFELTVSAKGTVHVPCNICLDDMEQPIEGSDVLTARLGDVSGSDDTGLVTVDRESGMLDTSWFVYETIALGIPIKHVHPEGECNPDMLRVLKEHQPKGVEAGETQVDPRWNALKELKHN